MNRIRGWSAVAAVVVFTLCLVTPASSQTARGPATRFTPTHPIDYPDTPPIDTVGDPVDGSGGLVRILTDSGLRKMFFQQLLANTFGLRFQPTLRSRATLQVRSAAR